MSLRPTPRGAAVALAAALFAAPLAVILLASLRAPGAPVTGLESVTPDPSLASYERAFELTELERQLLNSALVAAIAVPLSVFVASAAGFAMTLLSQRARRLAIAASLAALLVPLSALWVPRFVIFSELGLTGTYVPLIAPALLGASPLYVLLFHWSYRRVPRELVEAARLEGLGAFGIWRRVAAPLVRPTTLAVGALAFVFHWGNFVDPLLYLDEPSSYTAPLGLRALQDLGPADFPVMLAAAAAVTLPAALAFALAQRRFLDSAERVPWLAR